MQEEIERQSIVLAKQATAMTARQLRRMIAAALRRRHRVKKEPQLAPGLHTMRELKKDGAQLIDVPISDKNIGAFDHIARKYELAYSLKMNAEVDPPKWYVFFRAKDENSMTAAFEEFTAKSLNRAKGRVSLRDKLHKLVAQVKASPTKERSHDHGAHER